MSSEHVGNAKLSLLSHYVCSS